MTMVKTKRRTTMRLAIRLILGLSHIKFSRSNSPHMAPGPNIMKQDRPRYPGSVLTLNSSICRSLEVSRRISPDNTSCPTTHTNRPTKTPIIRRYRLEIPFMAPDSRKRVVMLSWHRIPHKYKRVFCQTGTPLGRQLQLTRCRPARPLLTLLPRRRRDNGNNCPDLLLAPIPLILLQTTLVAPCSETMVDTWWRYVLL